MSDTAGIKETIRALEAANHTLLAVDNGGGLVKVSTEAEAVDEATASDSAVLHVTLPSGKRGWVLFVLGNGCLEDLIADHTTNLSVVLDPLMDGWAA